MKFVHILLLLALLSILLPPIEGQESRRTLTNADIANMSKSGIGEQTILLTIQKGTTKFDTSPEALIELKAAGVTDAVLNAVLTASSEPVVTATQQDCSQSLDKVLNSIATPEKMASIHSSKLVGKNVVNRASGSATFALERVTIWSGSMHASLQPMTGNASTLVITPEFNYVVSGKMTTSVPGATLQEMRAGLRLEPIYISQHRTEYSCVLDGTEHIGSIDAAKLRIKSDVVEGRFSMDPATGRLLRITYQSSDSGPIATDYSDWKLVDGVNVAFKRHVSGNNGTTDATLSEYLVNPTIDNAMFQPPAGQVSASVTLKVLQAESVPYTVQTNGGISTSCNISGSTSTSMTATTYGNTTYGNATSTPNLQMNCRTSDTTIRWTHVLNAMFVHASDGNAYIIACDRAWAWSKCTPLKVGDTFLAKRGDKGFVVQSFNGKSKEKEATYSVLQSKSLRE
jgi:hypothetical protein